MSEESLSRLTRYESLFELSSEINAAHEIARVGDLMASRLKYVADVFSWRYLTMEHESLDSSSSERKVMIIDGYRGTSTINNIPNDHLSSVESGLCAARKTCFLSGETLAREKGNLPTQFQKDDIVQLFVHPHFEAGELQALFIFSRRRQEFNELDIKFITLAAQFFHEKVYMLWEQRKLRVLEQAYLQQEIMMRQNEKLATLGKLSAGVAHEINNPGAAVLRGSEQLVQAFARLMTHHHTLIKRGIYSSHHETLEKLEGRLSQSALAPITLDALERSDREYELETVLGRWAIDNAREVSPIFVKLDYRAATLEALREEFGAEYFPLLLPWMYEIYEVHSLMAEIHAGSKRISEIVAAMKSYTYMDQAALQEVDLHEGLNNTLIILRNRLKTGVTVNLDFVENIPCIQAYGSELNQVWTNIIDNAIDAMEEKGEITIRTHLKDDNVVVIIEDNGSGIPANVLPTIFDPFMTTKPPGEGTGLGLYVSYNIVVQKHKGKLTCSSQPGKTVFTICLPLNFEILQPDHQPAAQVDIRKA